MCHQFLAVLKFHQMFNFKIIKILSIIFFASLVLSSCSGNTPNNNRQYNQNPNGQYQQNYAQPYPPANNYYNPQAQYPNSSYGYGYQQPPTSRYYSNPYAMPPQQNVYSDQDQYYKPPASYGSYEDKKPSAYNSKDELSGSW